MATTEGVHGDSGFDERLRTMMDHVESRLDAVEPIVQLMTTTAAVATMAEIRRLVAKGRMTVDAARAEIEELIATHAIPEAIGREALGLLG
jgi:hypothetical protein